MVSRAGSRRRTHGITVGVQQHAGAISVTYNSHTKKYTFDVVEMRKEFFGGAFRDVDWSLVPAATHV